MALNNATPDYINDNCDIPNFPGDAAYALAHPVNTGSRYFDTSTGNIRIYNGTAWIDVGAATTSTSNVWFIREKVAANAQGPAASAATWHTRQMNDIDLIQPWATIVAPGEFTLQPGTYCIEGSAPAFQVLRHQTRIWDVTNATTEIEGTSEYAKNGTSTEGYNRSFVSGSVEITAATTYRFEHYTQQASAFAGLGLATSNVIDNIYAQLKITRVAD